jgi:Protein of unknown function (DUF3253)
MVPASGRRLSEEEIAREIVRQLLRRAADSSICPSEVARRWPTMKRHGAR